MASCSFINQGDSFMNPLNRLSDLFGQDLAGWQIGHCYFLELAHDLWGRFPAVSESGDPIFTFGKLSLKKVWERIERRSAKVTKIPVLFHLESGMFFNLEFHLDTGEMMPSRALSEKNIDELCLVPGSFHWAPGLFGSRGRVVDPDFTD